MKKHLKVETLPGPIEQGLDNPFKKVRKPSTFFIPPYALMQLGEVMKFGEGKHVLRIYTNIATCEQDHYDSIQRHLALWLEGHDIDPESGLPNMAHVMARAAIILDAQERGMLHRERPIPTDDTSSVHALMYDK